MKSAIYTNQEKSINQMIFPLVKRYNMGSSLNRIGRHSGLNQKSHGYSERYEFNIAVLTLLDELGCPLLLLPRSSSEPIRNIAFLTDIRSTGYHTLAALAKLAKSFGAAITIFNVPESALPKMDPDYAESYFLKNGMECVSDLHIKLVNIPQSGDDIVKLLLKDIDMVVAVRGRKSLLYQLAS